MTRLAAYNGVVKVLSRESSTTDPPDAPHAPGSACRHVPTHASGGSRAGVGPGLSRRPDGEDEHDDTECDVEEHEHVLEHAEVVDRHDTANAVATVIYTHSLEPHIAVMWSGTWNLIGVLLSSGAVAFAVVSLLPVELILKVGSGAGFAMVFALLVVGYPLEPEYPGGTACRPPARTPSSVPSSVSVWPNQLMARRGMAPPGCGLDPSKANVYPGAAGFAGRRFRLFCHACCSLFKAVDQGSAGLFAGSQGRRSLRHSGFVAC